MAVAAIALLETSSWAPERDRRAAATARGFAASSRRPRAGPPQPRRGARHRLHRDLLRAQPVPLRLLRRGRLGADRARHARRAARPAGRPARRAAARRRSSPRGRSALFWLWALALDGLGRVRRPGAHRGQSLAPLRRAVRRARAAAARRPARHDRGRRGRRDDRRASAATCSVRMLAGRPTSCSSAAA